jgi:hypothetical protein
MSTEKELRDGRTISIGVAFTETEFVARDHAAEFSGSKNRWNNRLRPQRGSSSVDWTLYEIDT